MVSILSVGTTGAVGAVETVGVIGGSIFLANRESYTTFAGTIGVLGGWTVATAGAFAV